MLPPTDYKARPQGHIINLIVQMREHHPSFTLFLGAGASINSGIKSAGTLIQEWREKYAAIHGVGDQEVLRHRDQPEEYAFLFQSLFDHPSQRRNFIETCLRGTSPSWGYIYLVNLIHAKVFNTVFTTNFDDLLNEACFAYSSLVRPVVCAHDSSINNLRIFSARPKIIKLHGDFLFDSIKNTVAETAALESNMRDKFDQYAAEFGMIVIGYSGHDRSVMDPLEKLLESSNTFPNGLYWCIRKGSSISRYVERLKRFPRFTLIEIEGFDEFCANLHDALGLTMQPELADPYAALTRKLDGLMRKMNLPELDVSHPVIERDVAKLAEQLVGMAVSEQLQSNALPVTAAGNANLTGVSNRIPVPFVFLGNFFLRRGEIKRAHICAAAALRQQASSDAFDVSFRALRREWDEGFANYLIDLLQKSIGMLRSPHYELTNFALEVLNAGHFEIAEKLFALSDGIPFSRDRFAVATRVLNTAQLFRHRGKPVPPDVLTAANQILIDETMPPVTRMGAAIICEDWSGAEQYLEVVCRTDPGLASQIPTWPIFIFLMPNIKRDALRQELTEIRSGYLAGHGGVKDIAHIDKIQRVLE